MKCIDNTESNAYTVGKIYEVIDSNFRDDTGYEFGKSELESFDKWCKFSDSKWELVEDNFKVKCIKEWYGVMKEGKIYNFINGVARLDDHLSCYYSSYDDFKMRNTSGANRIEEYKDHEFTLSDLEVGMKITTRDGVSGICNDDNIAYYKKYYNKDLTYNNIDFNRSDIVKVEKVILEPLYIRKTKKVTLQEVYDKFGEEVEII